MPRDVQPEWLDILPPEDPRARHARDDLKRVHQLMGHALTLPPLLDRELTRLRPPIRLVEIGAGDGWFVRSLAAKLAHRHPQVEVLLVDRCAAQRDTPGRGASAGWNTTTTVSDIFSWLVSDAPPADLMFCNLFLHHFKADELRTLLRLVAHKTRNFIACEPRRSYFALGASHLLGIVGCNDVTRHDAPVSVRAGFVDRDLTHLWPRCEGTDSWNLTERWLPPFSHLFCAYAP